MTNVEARTETQGRAALPLAGLVVLDLTRILSGPYCTLLLNELGADVIKVEKPGRGDHTRRTVGGPVKDFPYEFLAWNAGKKSITLDTWTEEGRDVFKDLVRHADVVLENFRAGVMEEMGLGFAALQQVNPRIVMTSITGWGQGSSLSRYAAHATVIRAFSGLIELDNAGQAPLKRAPGVSPDQISGIHAALGTLAALRASDKTGIGRHVDISMTSTVVGMMAKDLMFDRLWGPAKDGVKKRDDSDFRAFHDIYKARDGWLYIQADLEGEWRQLATAIGRPDLIADPRFVRERGRGERKAELDAIFGAWLADKTTGEAFRMLGPLGVPCSPVHASEDIADHPYLRERGFLHEIDHPRAGTVPVFGPRIQFTGEAPQAPSPAAELGEHNAEVFGKLLGYDEAKLDSLKQSGVI